MYIIITHVDPDGYACEYVVNKYINTIDSNSTIVRFNYNYQGDISNIDEYIDINLYQIKDIFITDVTLPDWFMDKYAKYITHIDHHKSAIEADKEWKHKLKHNYSAITVEGYKNVHNKQADQISACELTWLKLFPDKLIPLVLYYIGRYDVWDHDNRNYTILLNTYLTIEFAKEGLDVALTDKFDQLMQMTYNDFLRFMSDCIDLTIYKEKIDAAYCLRNCNVVKIFDKKVALLNQRTPGSQFFKAIMDKDSEVEVLMNFRYSPYENAWKISCYSVPNKEIKALNFIQRFNEVIPDIVNMGGHLDACGFTIKAGDIDKFLNCIYRGE